jgi:hypothetical protein
MREGKTVADRRMLRAFFGKPAAAVNPAFPSPYDPKDYRDRCPNGHDKPSLYPECGFCAPKGKEEKK